MAKGTRPMADILSFLYVTSIQNDINTNLRRYRSVVVRALDLQSTGRGFDSRTPHSSGSDPCQFVHIHM